MKIFSFLPQLKEKSIARNLTLSLIFIILLVISTLLTVQYFGRLWRMHQNIEKKADEYVTKLANILSTPLWTFDTNTIGRIGSAYAQNERFDQIRVVNHRGKIYFEYQGVKKARQTISRQKNITYDQRFIGQVFIVLSLDQDQKELNQFLLVAILVVIGVVLVIFITTGALLRHFISQPIASLQYRMDRVAQGDFSNNFEDIQYEELNAIAKRFSIMTFEIRKRENALERINQELSHEVTIRRQMQEERKELEEKLIRAEKMEAIGQLAGSVAHDLNNVLSGIVSYPDLLLFNLPDDSPMRQPLRTIQKAGKRAADIVQDLLTLARRGIQNRAVINLNDIISAYLHSPEWVELNTCHPYIKMIPKLAPDLMNINGSRHQLEKTLMNLIINGTESMRPADAQGNELTVTTFNQYVDKAIRDYETVDEGEYAVLQVADQGVGISPVDLKKIFEPFYTRKVMGRSGTGLGLAVVWGAVQDHKGYILVESAEKSGATFTLYFPVTREEIEQDDAPTPLSSYTGAGESVLVIDDVEEQREIACRILLNLGYVVNSVSGGEEAVVYMQKGAADLLLLDMIMAPGIDGLETYRQILKSHPHQKAVIASGFTADEDVKKAQLLGAGAYIKKPYTIEKIGMAVKSELQK